MARVKPIPTPARLRWREIRIRVVPAVMYLLVGAACVVLWVSHVAPPQLVGQVDIQTAHVNSTLAGRLTGLWVSQHQEVSAGEVLGQVLTTDPAVLESTLAVIRAEVGLLVARADPMLTRERAQVDFARLRLNWLEQRVQLATDRLRLQYAEAEAERLLSLSGQAEGIISQTELELALTERDTLRARVAETGELVAAVAGDMARFRLANPEQEPGPEATLLQAALSAQESQLKLAEAEMSPVRLTAPLNGVVTMIFRRTGENVAAGEPILTIASTQSDRIRAFVMPPWRDEPQVGMAVEVVRRSTRREAALAEVIQVGRASSAD